MVATDHEPLCEFSDEGELVFTCCEGSFLNFKAMLVCACEKDDRTAWVEETLEAGKDVCCEQA